MDWNKIILAMDSDFTSSGIIGLPKLYESKNGSMYQIYEYQLNAECEKF